MAGTGAKRGRGETATKGRGGTAVAAGRKDDAKRARVRKPAVKVVGTKPFRPAKMVFTAPARARGPKLRIEDLEEESSEGESFERDVRDLKERNFYEKYERQLFLESQQKKKLSPNAGSTAKKRDSIAQRVLSQDMFELPKLAVRQALDNEVFDHSDSEPSVSVRIPTASSLGSYREIPPEGKDPNRAKSHAFRQRYNRGLIKSQWVSPETDYLSTDRASQYIAELKRSNRSIGSHVTSLLGDQSTRRNFKMSDKVGHHFNPKTWFDVEKNMFRLMFASVGRDWKTISRLMGGTKSPTEVKKLYYEFRLKPLLADLTIEYAPVDPEFTPAALPVKPAATCEKDVLPRATPVATHTRNFRVLRVVSQLTSRPITDASLFQSGTLADSDRFLSSSTASVADLMTGGGEGTDICGPSVGSVVFAKYAIPSGKKQEAWFEAAVVDRRYDEEEGGLHVRVLLENALPHEAYWVSQGEWSCELAPGTEVWTTAPEVSPGELDLLPLPIDSLVGSPPKRLRRQDGAFGGTSSSGHRGPGSRRGTIDGSSSMRGGLTAVNASTTKHASATGKHTGLNGTAADHQDDDDEFIDVTSTAGEGDVDGASMLRSALLTVTSRCLELAHEVTMTLLNSLTTPPSPAVFESWAGTRILSHVARVPNPPPLEHKHLGAILQDTQRMNDPICERDLLFMAHESVFGTLCDIDIDMQASEQHLIAHFDAVIASADAAVEWVLSKTVSSATLLTTGGKTIRAAPSKAVVMHATGGTDHSDSLSQSLPAKIIESILLASSAVSSAAGDGGTYDVAVRGPATGPYTSTLAQAFLHSVYDTIQPRRLPGGGCSINGLAFFGNEVPEDKVPSLPFQQALVAKKLFLAKRELRLEIARLYRAAVESVSCEIEDAIDRANKTADLVKQLQSHCDTLANFHKLLIDTANKRLDFMRGNYLIDMPRVMSGPMSPGKKAH